MRSDSGGYNSPNLQKYTAESEIYQWHLRQFMQTLARAVGHTAPSTVLDAGCGEGFVTRFLHGRKPNWNLMGLDLSAPAIRYAHRHSCSEIRFSTGDLYDLPFAADAFDTVLCSEVLEHLECPDRAFRELRRVARRAVVVSVPREPYFRWLNGLGWAVGVSPDPRHVNFSNKRGFRRLVRGHLHQPCFETKHVYQVARGRVGSGA